MDELEWNVENQTWEASDPVSGLRLRVTGGAMLAALITAGDQVRAAHGWTGILTTQQMQQVTAAHRPVWTIGYWREKAG